MNAGLDQGFFAWKGVTGHHKIIFNSIAAPYHASSISLNGSHDIILNDQEGQWVIGRGSTLFDDRREDATWYRSPLYYRLMLAGFSQLTTGTAVEVVAVTGLPVSQYEVGKAEVYDRFMGEHRFNIEGRKAQRVNVVKCVVIQQPVGTLMNEAMTNAGTILKRELIEGPTAICDVGGKTSNFSQFEAGRDLPELSRSVNTGVWRVVQAVRMHLESTYPGLNTDHEAMVMQAIKQKRIWYHDHYEDLTEVVNEAAQQMASTLFSQATRVWGDTIAGLKAILITGGGAQLVGSIVAGYFKQAYIVPDSQFANAAGYWKYANLVAASK
jgi:plasmid segregation protein ParM